MTKIKEIKTMKIYFKPTYELKLGEFWFFTELVDLKGTSALHPKKVNEDRAMRLLREYPLNVFDADDESIEEVIEEATDVVEADAPEDVVVLNETEETPAEEKTVEPAVEEPPAWTKLPYRTKRDLAKELGYDGSRGYTNDIIVAYLIENPPKE